MNIYIFLFFIFRSLPFFSLSSFLVHLFCSLRLSLSGTICSLLNTHTRTRSNSPTRTHIHAHTHIHTHNLTCSLSPFSSVFLPFPLHLSCLSPISLSFYLTFSLSPPPLSPLHAHTRTHTSRVSELVLCLTEGIGGLRHIRDDSGIIQ